MPLRVAHLILIGAAIGLAAIFGLRSLVHYSHGHNRHDLALAFVSTVAALILSRYFVSVRTKWREAQRRA